MSVIWKVAAVLGLASACGGSGEPRDAGSDEADAATSGDSEVVADDGVDLDTDAGEDVEPEDAGTDGDATDGPVEGASDVEAMDASSEDGGEEWAGGGPVADFVLDALRIGHQDLGEGFDIDGVCTSPDDPRLPEDGPGCVDDAFGHLIDELERAGMELDFDGPIASEIAAGRLLVLLRHADVDGWVADPSMPSLAYLGHDADADPANNLTGAGVLLVDDRSLLDPADVWSAESVFADGALEDTAAADASIREGDYEARGPVLLVPLAVDPPYGFVMRTKVRLRDARLLWDLEAAPAGSPYLGGRLRDGLIGGWVPIGELVDLFCTIFGPTISRDTVATILVGQADIDAVPAGFTDQACSTGTDCAPGQTCAADPARGGAMYCREYPDSPDALSVGLVFHAVSCRIDGIWHDPAGP